MSILDFILTTILVLALVAIALGILLHWIGMHQKTIGTGWLSGARNDILIATTRIAMIVSAVLTAVHPVGAIALQLAGDANFLTALAAKFPSADIPGTVLILSSVYHAIQMMQVSPTPLKRDVAATGG